MADRTPRLRHWAAFVGAAVCALLWAAPATAHPLDPVLFELREKGGGNIEVTWKGPTAKVPGVELFPILPPECRSTSEVANEVDEDAVISRWTLDCGPGGLVGRTVGVSGLESTDALLRVELLSGAINRRVLGAAEPTMLIEAAPTRTRVAFDYTRLGVDHIAGGIDHLLFVFGLLLLVGGTRALLATITAFTLGHSVTLAAAALELVRVPQGPVEVVIAATIYVLAVELARPAPGEAGASAKEHFLRRRPWAMAFSFGLLHGLGFAGALREAGLPANDVPLALLSFNVGIELGQVAFVAVVLGLYAVSKNLLAGLPSWVRFAPVYAMGSLACYWMIERAMLLA
jgi:hypothetical protein